MDDLDKRILTDLQTALPLAERPFHALAERLGVPPDDLLVRVRRLANVGIIRRIGPVFDSGRLGYVSRLVAARVPADRVEDAAAHVNRLPGVTHNYERRGAYNLWFTLTAPSQADLERALDDLRRDTGIPDFHSLPALAVYKVRVHFDVAGEAASDAAEPAVAAARPPPSPFAPGRPAPAPPRRRARSPGIPPPLSEQEKQLVRLLQDGLPVEREPFAEAARRLGWTDHEVAEQVRAWLARGVIRRFGAVVRHRELGFRAGGMAVFRVPADEVDAAGRRLAAHAEVSHCYRRPPLPDFPYNLFAMVHGRSEAAVREAVARMAADAGLAEYDVLLSGREFKKASMRYYLED